jgi:hypothetical protein
VVNVGNDGDVANVHFCLNKKECKGTKNVG